jgi:hypothetical protein
MFVPSDSSTRIKPFIITVSFFNFREQMKTQKSLHHQNQKNLSLNDIFLTYFGSLGLKRDFF